VILAFALLFLSFSSCVFESFPSSTVCAPPSSSSIIDSADPGSTSSY
jgi:hypothetical protein